MEASTLEEATFKEVSSVVVIKVVLVITEGVVFIVVEAVVFMEDMVPREDTEVMDLMAATIVAMAMVMVVEDIIPGTITIDLLLADLMMPDANCLLAMCVPLKSLFI